MKKNTILLLLIFFFGSNCGYKIINQKELRNFNIAKIETFGDKRVNYKIKNKLLLNAKKNEKKIIKIILNTDKSKNIKEKNIKNEVTKYEVNILIKVKFREIDVNIFEEFVVKSVTEYSVSNQHSQTLTNERKATELLIEDLSDKIISEIILKINDL
jgi:hypothetical protein